MKDMEKGIQKVLAAGAGLLLLLAGGCVEADLGERPETGDLLPVEIPTGVSPLRATAPVDTKSLPDTTRSAVLPDSLLLPTRAAGATYKRAIVLQYKNDALLNTGSTDMNDYTIGTSVSASLQEATGCNIYVLAVNETTTTGAGDVFSTETKLKAATYDLYSLFPIPTDDQIPLAGSLRGVDVLRMTVDGIESGVIAQGSGSDGTKVELSRIAARFDLALLYGVPGYKALAESGQIRNVPAKMYLLEQPGERFPAEDEAVAFTDISFTLSDCDGDNNEQPATKLTRYLPANIRGTNPAVTLPREKYSGTAPKTTVDRCTYVSFVAQEKKDANHKLVYSFYLGGNTTSDFNVRRNYIYTINSTVAQTGEGDLRVSEQGAVPRLETDPMAQAVSPKGATLRAVLETDGTAVTEYGFYYKKDTPFEGADGAVKMAATGLTENAYTADLTGLMSKSVYYFRAYVIFQGQTLYGSQASFATNAEGTPVLSTANAPVSAVNGLSAASSANTVTGVGILSQGIVYSPTGGFDYQAGGMRAAGNPATTSPFSVDLPGLTKGTTYYYRHYASNAQGYTYSSSERNFRTKDTPAIPTGGRVVSTVVDQLTFSATLPERKNEADDYPTAAGLKYWSADPADLSAAGSTKPFASPETPGARSVNWTGMVPGQPYWYTFYSTNGVGTEYSEKQTFTSSALLSAPDPATMQIGPQAAGTFTVTTIRNTNALATAGAEVLSVATGNGTESKTVDMVANTTPGGSREATLTFTTIGELPLRSNTMVVTQYGVVFPESFSDVSNIDKGDTGEKSVEVLSNIPWQATSDQDWCGIDGVTTSGSVHTGTNNESGSTQSFTYKLSFNSTGSPRVATITVQGTGAFTGFTKTFTVTQMGDGNAQLNPQDPTSQEQENSFVP